MPKAFQHFITQSQGRFKCFTDLIFHLLLQALHGRMILPAETPARKEPTGADACDVVVASGNSLSVGIREGAVENSNRSESDALYLRVFCDKKIASVTSNTKNDPQSLAERAVAMAKQITKNSINIIDDPHMVRKSEETEDNKERLDCDRVLIADPIDGTRDTQLLHLVFGGELENLDHVNFQPTRLSLSLWILLETLTPKQPFIVGVWHGQHVLMPALPIGLNASAMISKNFDGEVTARVVEHFGNRTIRASGGRSQKQTLQKGGMTGFLEMLNALRENDNVVQTADIPKGIARRAGLGIIMLGQKSGVPNCTVGNSFKQETCFCKSLGIKQRSICHMEQQQSLLGELINVPKMLQMMRRGNLAVNNLEKELNQLCFAFIAALAWCYTLSWGRFLRLRANKGKEDR
ncbi:hypothetical protein GQR58_028575 [Nymphon striatum]|nr:hypothetical protein GQR58_028575 [Nymphon striatum]